MHPTWILALAAAAALGLGACKKVQPLPAADHVRAPAAPISAEPAPVPLTHQVEPQAPGPGVFHPGRDHDRVGPLPPSAVPHPSGSPAGLD